MKPHEFHRKYASLPLGKRGEFLGYTFHDEYAEQMTMNSIYTRIKEIEDKIRPEQIELEKLLRIATRWFYLLEHKKDI
jgi:hypothetical protein